MTRPTENHRETTAAAALAPLPGTERLRAEAAALRAMNAAATPPAGMTAAATAPARGVMELVEDWDLTPGGTRRYAGLHWLACDGLARMVAQARQRHASQQQAAAFVPWFSPDQLDVARVYRSLVEWRAGSAIKCASMEAGCGGAASGTLDYIDRFIIKGDTLAAMRAAIGAGVALNPRRMRATGEQRRSIPDLVLVDMVVLRDFAFAQVLCRFGWVPDDRTRSALRLALRGALDRMRCVI